MILTAAIDAFNRWARLRDLGGAAHVNTVMSQTIQERREYVHDLIRRMTADGLRHLVTNVDGSERSVRADQKAPMLMRAAKMHSSPPPRADSFARA